MNLIEWFIEWLGDHFLELLIAAAIAALAWLCYIAATEPSCEDRGGVSKFQYFLPVNTGKSTVLVPIYSCEGAKP